VKFGPGNGRREGYRFTTTICHPIGGNPRLHPLGTCWDHRAGREYRHVFSDAGFFTPAIEHFWKAGVVPNFGYRDAVIGQQFGGAAGGENFHIEFL